MSASQGASHVDRLVARAREIAPGAALAVVLTVAAIILASVEKRITGYEVLEPLVLGLILGVTVRSCFAIPALFMPGIAFVAKQVLELAIVLLGASLDMHQLAQAGWKIVFSVLLIVPLTIATGIIVGRAVGLGTRLAILVGVGNAICGNSAIAAVAPAIRAKREEVVSAIALTAVFGIGVVLALPLIGRLFDLSDERYGVVAGLSVYAVPQVLAATIPVSAVSGQVGSLVKLTRVLLLGPTVAAFAWWTARTYPEPVVEGVVNPQTSRAIKSITTYLPWFVIGFVILATLRTAQIIPDDTGASIKEISRIMTAIAMTALGLTVDVKTVRQGGMKVAFTIAVLTVLLVATALVLVTTLDIG